VGLSTHAYMRKKKTLTPRRDIGALQFFPLFAFFLPSFLFLSFLFWFPVPCAVNSLSVSLSLYLALPLSVLSLSRSIKCLLLPILHSLSEISLSPSFLLYTGVFENEPYHSFFVKFNQKKVWNVCAITHWYVCHDSLICVPWLIDMCDMTHSPEKGMKCFFAGVVHPVFFSPLFSWWVLQHCTGFARLVWGRLRVHRAVFI